MDQKSLQNKSLQNNPNNVCYWQTRGHSTRPSNWGNETDHKKRLGQLEYRANTAAATSTEQRKYMGNDTKRVEQVVKQQLGGNAMIYKGGSQHKRTNVKASDLDLKIKVSESLQAQDRTRLGNALKKEFGTKNVDSSNPKIHIVQGKGVSIDVVPTEADYFPPTFKIDKLGKNPFSSNPTARHAVRNIKTEHKDKNIPGIKVERAVLRIQTQATNIPLDQLIEKTEKELNVV